MNSKFSTVAYAKLFDVSINHKHVEMRPDIKALLEDIDSEEKQHEFVKYYGTHLIT